jgi:tRNA (mo5U34)-methyltransferase
MNEILKEKIKKYNFYHRIKVEENIYTRDFENEHFSHRKIEEKISKLDFENKRVLDIGCRDGFFSFYAEKKGAKEIIGIDNNISKGAIEFLIPYFNSRVKMYEKNLYDVDIKDFGQFDIIFFFGVLYHLKDPVRHILKLGEQIKTGIMLDTHIADDSDVLEQYNVGENIFQYKKYLEFGSGEVFSGMHDHSKWLTLNSLENTLMLAGFLNITVVEIRRERNGPRVLLFAEK